MTHGTTSTHAPATVPAEQRLVIAPAGMVWVDGNGRHAGGWEPAEGGITDGSVAREAHEDGDAGWKVVPVAADEPAAQADLMALAAEVEQLRERNTRLVDMLTAVEALRGSYLTDAPRS
jgi:hypothetical protein